MYQNPAYIATTEACNLREDFNYLQRIPGLALVKNLNSEFCSLSRDFAQLIGFSHVDQYLGMTEYDISCETRELASLCIKNDQRVITSENESFCLTIGKYSAGLKVLICSTKPIYNTDGRISGVFLQAKDISNSRMIKKYLNLTADDHLIIGKSRIQTMYTLNNHQLPCSLTARQEECLFFLVRGKSIKEIARIMCICERTVEEYIALLKEKLGCDNRSQLIEKALNHEFMSFISDSFFVNVQQSYSPLN